MPTFVKKRKTTTRFVFACVYIRKLKGQKGLWLQMGVMVAGTGWRGAGMENFSLYILYFGGLVNRFTKKFT